MKVTKYARNGIAVNMIKNRNELTLEESLAFSTKYQYIYQYDTFNVQRDKKGNLKHISGRNLNEEYLSHHEAQLFVDKLNGNIQRYKWERENWGVK